MNADELKLVEGCRKGDADARKQLYTLYAEQMLAVCYRYTGNLDDAYDVLHDGFIKIFTNFSFRGESALKSWMYKVMSAQAIDFMRRKSASRLMLMDNEELPDIPDVDEKAVMYVSDFRDLGYLYLMQIGENIVACAECGVLMRGNKAGTKKYCRHRLMEYPRRV